MSSDASFESQNLSDAVAAAHIQWIFFNLSYMSVYMRILFNLFNSMRSATTDALTGEEKGEEPLKRSLNPTANKTTYSYTWSITARELSRRRVFRQSSVVTWGDRSREWSSHRSDEAHVTTPGVPIIGLGRAVPQCNELGV